MSCDKYFKNKTMKMIGEQNIGLIDGISDEIDDVLKSTSINEKVHLYDVSAMYDAVLLGIIAGKRMERARKVGVR